MRSGATRREAVERELDAAGVEAVTGVEVVDEPRARAAPAGELADVILLPEQPADGADALIGEPSDPARVRLGSRLLGRVRAVDLASDRRRPVYRTGWRRMPSASSRSTSALKVCGSERVWAAGGCIAAALEHSALAARAG